MKRNILALLSVVLIVALAILWGCTDKPTDPGSGMLEGAGMKTQTGQGIWVNFTLEGTYSFSSTNTYKYNLETAATYFTNLWDGATPTPVVKQTKTTTSTSVMDAAVAIGTACDPSLAVPDAPPPDASKLLNNLKPGKEDVVGVNQCKFLDGLDLVGLTYTQTVDQSSSCSYVSACTLIAHGPNTGKYSVTTTTVTVDYSCTFTYNITPTSAYTHQPFTAWDLTGTSGGTGADITLKADIAGESVVKSAQFPTAKYSFSLRADDGISSRVQNLALTVDGTTTPVNSTLVENAPGALPGDPGAVDFTYATNAGSNGTVALLLEGDARGILNGTVTATGLVDKFKGNDNGGADGTALAKAVMDPTTVTLGEGIHTVTLTGVVKGNSASTGDIPITITHTLTVVTPGCGGGQ